MKFRQTALAIVLVAAGVPTAFADSGSTWIGGEIGFRSHPVQSQLTRAEVLQELEAFRKNPVTSDGGLLVGGELGYVAHQHAYGDQSGSPVHMDRFPATRAAMGNAAAPLSDAEHRAMRDQYIS